MLAVLSSFLIGGCQKSEDVDETQRKIHLEVRFPDSLARGTARHRDLLSRVTHLQLKMISRSGFHKDTSIAPEHWDNIQLSAFDFPRDDSDELEIVAELWDRLSEKQLRPVPLLRGTHKIRAKQMNDSTVRVQIRLQLAVPFSEWK